MIITLRNSLGKELLVYHSYDVPRATEYVNVTLDSDPMMWKVMGVLHQVHGSQGDAVDLEVLPANEAARNHVTLLYVASDPLS